MESETFSQKTEANHQQEAQAKDNDGGVRINKPGQRFGSDDHDTHGDHHRRHHDAQLFHHAHCRNDCIQ